jgi:hypothetical protein
MTRNVALLSTTLSSLLLLSACGGADGPPGGWAGSVDTLETGRIVVHNPDVPAWTEAWMLRERFRLGSMAEEGPELLGQIAGLELGPGGEVYVLDGQASEIRVFGGDGSFQHSFGGWGEGPGELNSPSGLALDAQGTLWVMNWGNGRYSGYDPATGEVSREARRLASFASFPWPGKFEEGRRLIDIGLNQDGEPAILRLDTAFVPADTLGFPEPDDADRIFFRDGSTMVASLLDPFAPRPTWAPRPRGGIVLGEGRAFRIHRVRFTGDTILTMELRREPVETTRAERDSAVAFIEKIAGSLGGAVPDRRPNPRATKPAHGQIFVDDRDRTWVWGVPPAGGTPAWEVFGADGRYLGPVPVPDPPAFLPPVLRGSRMAVASEVDGYPVVIVYDLVQAEDDGV